MPKTSRPVTQVEEKYKVGIRMAEEGERKFAEEHREAKQPAEIEVSISTHLNGAPGISGMTVGWMYGGDFRFAPDVLQHAINMLEMELQRHQ